MLYIFLGTDIPRAKARARELTTDCEIVRLGEGGEDMSRALSFLESQGLFAKKPALIFDRACETEEGKAFIFEHAEIFHESDAFVFVIEEKLSATDAKKFPKGVHTESFDGDIQKVPAAPNVFAFTDAFLARDRKGAWVRYRSLISAGVSPEEIHGAAAWAVRSVLLALKTKDANASGLKPFVYSKSKKAGERLGVAGFESLSRELSRRYHRSRMGHGDLELLLEDLILMK